MTSPYGRIAIVATEPLPDNERRVHFYSGQLMAVKDGAQLSL